MSDVARPAAPLRIVSGIQPTGPLHLGNYFGMIRPLVALQLKGDVFCFVADLHALTTVRDADALRQFTRDVALDLLAAGLDPERTVLYRQSDVPEVAELTWILSTLTPLGLLERAHAFKDKRARGLAASHALLAYPVLMAADILLYGADLVPVGPDQLQHLEITRDIAAKFNAEYGPLFTLPRPSIVEDVGIIRGTDGRKMSKSYGNAIALGLTGPSLRERVMGIVTNSAAIDDAKDPSGSTLVQLYGLVAPPADVGRMEEEFRTGGVGYGALKQRLHEAIEEHFAPFRGRREALARDPATVDRVLAEGAERARAVAVPAMARVRRAVGLR